MIDLFGRQRRERELDEEIRTHLEMAIRDRVARGESRADAERAVRREFGDTGRVKEVTRTMWRGSWLDRTGRDLRYSVQGMRRAPGFAAAVIVTLALGVGATATVFTFADSILLQPLPYPNADRLVTMGHSAEGLDVLDAQQSDGTYLHYRAHNRTLGEIATWYENVVNLGGADGEEPERVPIAMVSSPFFDVLGARAAVGRLPSIGEVERVDAVADPYANPSAGGTVEVVISYDLWTRRYGADPGIVGRTIEANRAQRVVIGVLERGFAFPRPETAIWYTEDPNPAAANAFDMFKPGIGRLRPGVNALEAERDLDRLIPLLPEAYPDFTPELLAQARLRAIVTPLKDQIVGEADRALWLLVGGMALLLAIACANVANLFLVRAEHRQRDIAVRTALGAGARDLVRLFAAESLVLAAAGGALGLVGAAVAVESLVGLVPPEGLPRLSEVALGGRTVALCAALSVGIACFLALVPAFRGPRREVALVLREATPASTAAKPHQRARAALVAGQLALALTLLIGSALMLQSLLRLHALDLGFVEGSVLTAEVALPYRGYEEYGSAQRLWDGVVGGLRALPGVEAAGHVSGLPLVPRPAYYDLAIRVEDRPEETYAGMTVYFASPGYFETLQIPVVQGRAVAHSDPGEERPVLLSAAAARRLFPGESAVGQRIRRAVASGRWLTVVGVVGDVPAERIGGEPLEVVYVPTLEAPVDPGRGPGQGTLVLRTSVPAATLAPALRDVVRSLDPNLPVSNVRTMERIVADANAPTTFTLLLLVVASVTALILGVVGVYGVTSYAVGRRAQEIGLRVALGARVPDVERMVLRDSSGVVLAGVVVGTATALGLTRFMEAMLFGVTATDPATFAAMASVLLVTATIASWLPARRAARSDPRRALRGP